MVGRASALHNGKYSDLVLVSDIVNHMDRRSIFAMMAMVLLASCLVPLALEDGDALVDDDVVVLIDGDRTMVKDVTVGSGSSSSFNVIVFNNSDYPLAFSAKSTTDGVTTIATEVMGANGSVIDPNSHIEFAVTVSADKYVEKGSETGLMTMKFTDNTGVTAVTKEVIINITVESEFGSDDQYNKFFGAIPNTLDGFLGSAAFAAIVTLLVWIVVSIIATSIVVPLLTRVVGTRKSDDEKKAIRRSLTKLVTALIAIVAINQCIRIVGAGADICQAVGLVSNILYVVICAGIAWIVYMFVVTAVLKGIESASDVGVDSSLIPLFKMLGQMIIAVGSVAAILAMFGVDLTGILLSAGVITLGITMGAQNTLSQFFSGIVLLSTRPFRKGDFVKIGGEVYIVRRVKLMFTEFDNWDKDQVVTIPNNVVSNGTIVNMTGESSDARIFVYVTVEYGSDLKKVSEIMVQAAMEHDHVIKDGSRSMPSTRLTNLLESGIEFRLAAFVDDFDSTGGIAGDIRTRIVELCRENDIEIPYNKLDVNILNTCDGKLREGDDA